MPDKLFIPIILGTNRDGRQSGNAAKFIADHAGQRDDLEVQLFDVADFELPIIGYGTDIKDRFPEWRDAMAKADGLIIVSPEYNHSFPGRLKSVLDLLLKEYIHKAVGLVGVSSGILGGARVIEVLVPMVRELGLAVTFTDMIFPKVQDIFDESGKLLDEDQIKRADTFLDELTWMAKTLKWGRENLPSQHHS